MRQITKEFLLHLLKNNEEDIDKLLEKRKNLLSSANASFNLSYPERLELQSNITDMQTTKAKLLECSEEIIKL